MKEFFGIILLDKTEIILRVYQIEDMEWRLFNYFTKTLIPEPTPEKNAESFSYLLHEIMTNSFTEQVTSWRICSRGIEKSILRTVAHEVGMPIEPLTYPREQELISKGMFTELW